MLVLIRGAGDLATGVVQRGLEQETVAEGRGDMRLDGERRRARRRVEVVGPGPDARGLEVRGGKRHEARLAVDARAGVPARGARRIVDEDVDDVHDIEIYMEDY